MPLLSISRSSDSGRYGILVEMGSREQLWWFPCTHRGRKQCEFKWNVKDVSGLKRFRKRSMGISTEILVSWKVNNFQVPKVKWWKISPAKALILRLVDASCNQVTLGWRLGYNQFKPEVWNILGVYFQSLLYLLQLLFYSWVLYKLQIIYKGCNKLEIKAK